MAKARTLTLTAAPAWGRRCYIKEVVLAKPNYSFEKRQRELARKKKQEEKRQRHARPKDEAAPRTTTTDGAEPSPATPAADGSTAAS